MCDQIIPENKSYKKINKDFKVFSRKPNLKLPLIRLHYGPRECNGFIKHKPQKLHGLATCLRKLNFDVELIPSSHLNVLNIVILGHEVQRINTKFLQFNIDCNFDSVCSVILEKIEEATTRLYSDINIAKDIEIWNEEMQQDLSASTESESYDGDLSSEFLM